ncbi:MAG TPA: DEAD/DEAH box helicase, partial [Candidatus Acidoferrales bacterium]|nr:DEAD/DEAH box helicase [Candidatus Acidoferrales bacterium]
METFHFHPLVDGWFRQRFGEPTAPQAAGWRHIAGGRDTLIAAPTGSGKTLAAFLWAINCLVERASAAQLTDSTSVVYVSPLKALANDIQKNLQQPLAEIRELARQEGTPLPEIRVFVRSGDTPAHERQAMVKRPPHILITTPESLYILLTAERSRRMLAQAETVIVDEIHAVAADKRGMHLTLSLERLDALAKQRLQRIGLSATQKPIEEIARLLVGTDRLILGGAPDCAIVDTGHQRTLDLSVEVTDHELGPIATHELHADIFDRIVGHTKTHRTTIVFVNTRRLVERVAHQLAERLGKDKVAAHHGSMSRYARLAAEEGLKSGAIPVVVATASLELGIDVGHVDLVCHLGAPRAIATFLQRVGRSGHWLGAVPKGILFPTTRDDLLQCAAVVRAIRHGMLDRIIVPENALDILAQQIVATVAGMEISEKDLWDLVRRSFQFRNLRRDDFEAVLEMLCEGVSTRRGRRSAHLHRDRVHGMLRPRRGARMTAILNGGAIPDTADYDVIEDPTQTFVGRVNEDFAIESMAGDIFLLGNRSWRIRRVESGKVRVEDAQGLPPTIPFWLGEAPARTPELSAAIGEIRQKVAELRHDLPTVTNWLMEECGVDLSAAQQIIAYVAETHAALGAVPTPQTVIAERFFDEGGGMQLVVHAPFGGRINRAWGLALRKRFCRTFDFELQAAATDDGIVLSLGEQHSFPIDNVFNMVSLHSLRDDLLQAALAAPMFGTRWRWNVTRALALQRNSGGKKVPLQLQRMRAEDLLAAVFPAQLACGDNHPGGPVEPPDHPLVNETVANCLHEVMDLDGLRVVLEAIEGGSIRTVAVETVAPSPMSHEILNANPYAFLDDAPLEERRARAVSLRRVDPDLAGGVGALDQTAIDEVRRQSWPDIRDSDELHDFLLSVGVLPKAQVTGQIATTEDRQQTAGDRVPESVRSEASILDSLSTAVACWSSLADQLASQRRVTVATWDGRCSLVAAERVDLLRRAVSNVAFDPPPAPVTQRLAVDEETAIRSIVQGWMDCLGPVTVPALATFLGLPENKIEVAMYHLESDGVVLQGRFTPTGEVPPTAHKPSSQPIEWCERRLLARIHRLTLNRLRREIEAVSAADYIRFLLRWQHVQPGTQLHGRDGVLQVVTQLQGVELPAPAWERDVLPSRINQYESADLDQVCLSGEVAWGRLRLSLPEPTDAETAEAVTRRVAPTRSAPLAFVRRDALEMMLEPLPDIDSAVGELSSAAQAVLLHLQRHGAHFLADIARGTGLLPTQTEDALWELVARGLVTGDGVAGLRTLLLPELKRREPRHRLRALPGGAKRRLLPAGRWSLLRPSGALVQPSSDRNSKPSGRRVP